MNFGAIRVTALTFILLLLLSWVTIKSSYAVDCTSPGTGSSSDYPYDSAANTYVICTILSAQATIMAYTPTPTPTLMPTAQAIASSTGCTSYGRDPNTYQNCVINDAEVRSNSYIFWTIPLILVAIIAFGVTSRGRFTE